MAQGVPVLGRDLKMQGLPKLNLNYVHTRRSEYRKGAGQRFVKARSSRSR